jgi:hypothetical protein
MKKILFVAYGAGHINIINLIARGLLNEKTVDFKILALTTGYDKIVDNYPSGIVKKISDYKKLFASNIDEILFYGKELLGDTYNDNIGISKNDLIFYLGISMFDLVKVYGLRKAKELYKIHNRNIFLPIDTMKKILIEENIDIVVSTTSPRFERASLIAGRELQLETVQIIDLFSQLSCPPEAKHIITMSESISHDLRKKYNHNAKYYALGQPVVEESVKNILSINKFSVRNKLNLNHSKSVVLFASQVPIAHDDKCNTIGIIDYQKTNDKVFSVLDNLYKNENIEILFRLHPNENYQEYMHYFKVYPYIKYINKELTLYESIAVADYIITPFSTVGLEAVSAGKTVFTYKNDFDKCYPTDEMKEKPFIYANTFSELYSLVTKNINRKFEEKNCFIIKNSVENIIKLIKEL